MVNLTVLSKKLLIKSFRIVLGSDGNGTWVLTEVIEDSRGKMHHFRLDGIEDGIGKE